MMLTYIKEVPLSDADMWYISIMPEGSPMRIRGLSKTGEIGLAEQPPFRQTDKQAIMKNRAIYQEQVTILCRLARHIGLSRMCMLSGCHIISLMGEEKNVALRPIKFGCLYLESHPSNNMC